MQPGQILSRGAGLSWHVSVMRRGTLVEMVLDEHHPVFLLPLFSSIRNAIPIFFVPLLRCCMSLACVSKEVVGARNWWRWSMWPWSVSCGEDRKGKWSLMNITLSFLMRLYRPFGTAPPILFVPLPSPSSSDTTRPSVFYQGLYDNFLARP